MQRRYPRLSADELFRPFDAPPLVGPPPPRPVLFHAARPIKTAQGPRYLCRECGETLGVCSCFRPVRLEP